MIALTRLFISKVHARICARGEGAGDCHSCHVLFEEDSQSGPSFCYCALDFAINKMVYNYATILADGRGFHGGCTKRTRGR